MMMKLRANKVPHREIAAVMGRSQVSIRCRVQKLKKR